MVDQPRWTPPSVTAVIPDAETWTVTTPVTAYESHPWSVALILDTMTGTLTAERNHGQYPRMGTIAQRDQDAELINAGGHLCSAGWRRLAFTATLSLDHDRLLTLFEHAVPIVERLLAALRPLPGSTTWDWSRAAVVEQVRLDNLISSHLTVRGIARAASGGSDCGWVVDMVDVVAQIPQIADPVWITTDDAGLDRVADLITMPNSTRRRLVRTALNTVFPLPFYADPDDHEIVGTRSALRAWRDNHAGAIVPLGPAAPTHGPVLPCVRHQGDGPDEPVLLQVEAPREDAAAMAREFVGRWITTIDTEDGVSLCSMFDFEAQQFLAHLHKHGYTARIADPRPYEPADRNQ